MHSNIHKGPAYLLSQAILYLITNKPAEALANLDASLSLHKSADTTTWRGITRFLMHDFEGALSDFGVWDATNGSGEWRSRGHETNLAEFNQQTHSKRWPWPRPENYLESQWAVIQSQWSAALDVFEQAGVREPTDSRYLSERFSEYCFYGWKARGLAQYPRALRDAEAVLSADTTYEYSHLRALRAQLRLRVHDLDYAALLEDYKCLLEQTEIMQAEESYQNDPDWEYRVDLSPLARTHDAHCCAWALYRLGDLAGSRQYFATLLAYEYPQKFRARNWWSTWALPPVPDDEYLLWQLRQQLPLDNPRAYSWLSEVLKNLPEQMVGNLADVFNSYLLLNPQLQPDQPDPDDYSLKSAIQYCQEQMEQAPPAVHDLHEAIYQLMLQVQQNRHLTGPPASPVSDAAVL